MKLAIDENLAFGDVAGKIRNGVSDIYISCQRAHSIQAMLVVDVFTIVRHGQDRYLRDGAVPAFNTPCALVDCRQVGIHVSRVASSTGHFFSSGRDLTQGVAVRRQIRENDQHMLFELIGVILGCRESESRSDDALNATVV